MPSSMALYSDKYFDKRESMANDNFTAKFLKVKFYNRVSEQLR